MFDVTPSPTSSEASSHSSPSHSSHYESSPHASPPASVPHSPAGSPAHDSSSSSSAAPSPQRVPFIYPTNYPMHPHYHSHCFHNSMPPGLHYLPGMRFIASLLVPRPIQRCPTPPPLSQTPEVSVKGFLATPPLSITSTLSSLSPLSLSPPKSPERDIQQGTLPTTSASLSTALTCTPTSKPIRASTSLPRLSFKIPPPPCPSTSSRSQSMKPQPPYKSLKKSVSEPNLHNQS